MVKGITYDGEIGILGRQTTPEEAIEIICTDPKFVEKAAAKKPNFFVRAYNGARSFPADWWYGATFIATRANIFDVDGRMNTDAQAQKCIDILLTAWNNPGFTARLIWVLGKHLLHYPEFYGRQGLVVGTGVLTTALLSYVGLGSFAFYVGLVNFFLATTGATVRAVENGATTLAEILVAQAIGEVDPNLVEKVEREMMSFSPSDGNYDIPADDEKIILFMLDGTLDCLRNPNKYLLNRENMQRPTVAVGQVSSMRMPGVMGRVEIGYETNALDVIGDMNAITRYQ